MNESEIRKDYFKDEYVIIAPKRDMRPKKIVEPTVAGATRSCYFCPDNFDKNQTITYRDNNENGDWEILSFLNKYPAVTFDNPKAYGQAEVILETRKHGLEINDFSIDHIIRVFDVYINRYELLRKTSGVKYVIVFKNEGGKAGASIPHSHSQIIALPIVPPNIRDEVRDYNEYRLTHDNCPYCDIIVKESGTDRVIWEDDNVFVLSPYASNYPYGVWILPKRHFKSIIEMTHVEKVSIAKSFKIVLGKLNELGLSYNYFFENSVQDGDYHMHVKIAPRPNVWAGLELGTGVIVNPVSPEFAAATYKS
jgi:UDPglucose--hexose-1-phosphate uridylyltransferase